MSPVFFPQISVVSVLFMINMGNDPRDYYLGLCHDILMYNIEILKINKGWSDGKQKYLINGILLYVDFDILNID